MALRLTSRGRARGASLRGTGALLAVAVTTGLTAQVTPAVAAESTGASGGAESYLADLVGKVTETRDQVTSLENDLGGLRESVNKSRVDLDRSVQDAQNAQNEVTDARSRLGGSQTDLDKAQANLDEISRSAYTQGGDASPVPLAAGSSADDAIDRATYIRMAAEKQQAEVDRLDLARTQAANEESGLRESRNTADSMVEAARQAQDQAQQQFAQVQQELADKAQTHQSLLAEAQTAQRQLDAARTAVNRVVDGNADATSFDKRRAAEAAVDKVGTAAPATAPAVPATPAAPAAPATTDDAAGTATTAPSAAPAATGVPDGAKIGGTGTTAAAAATAAAETAATTATTASAETTATATEQDAAATGDTTGTAAAADTSPADGSFTQDTAGDDRRQAAIDGLVGAAGAALVAGGTAALNGNDPLSAAAQAARSSAAQSYADLPTGTASGNGSGVGEDTGTVPATTPGTGGTSGHTGNTGDTSAPDTSGTSAAKIERVINRGMSQLGVTYAWGGGDANGPTLGIRDGGVADAYGDYAKIGFDCSGLMMYAFNAVGIELPHYSGYQYTSGTQVPVDEAQRGDMLFWGAGGSDHVALYLGDGQMLEAPQSGDVVRVSDVRWSGIEPYATRMIG